MEREEIGKYVLVGGILFTIIIGGISLLVLLTFNGGDERSSVSYDFTSTIDSVNNSVTMAEPNRTVNWNEYLVVVNGTFVMKRSWIAVPGTSTTFYHDDWDPNFGCCYDVKVVERGDRRKVWNGTVEAE